MFADDTLNDPAFISQEIADLEAGNPNFADTAQQLYDWQKRFMEVWLVDRGIISREMFNKLWAVDPNYVPFDRDVIGRPSAKKKGFRQVFRYTALKVVDLVYTTPLRALYSVLTSTFI